MNFAMISIARYSSRRFQVDHTGLVVGYRYGPWRRSGRWPGAHAILERAERVFEGLHWPAAPRPPVMITVCDGLKANALRGWTNQLRRFMGGAPNFPIDQHIGPGTSGSLPGGRELFLVTGGLDGFLTLDTDILLAFGDWTAGRWAIVTAPNDAAGLGLPPTQNNSTTVSAKDGTQLLIYAFSIPHLVWYIRRRRLRDRVAGLRTLATMYPTPPNVAQLAQLVQLLATYQPVNQVLTPWEVVLFPTLHHLWKLATTAPHRAERNRNSLY